VQIELPLEQRGVGLVADGDEDAVTNNSVSSPVCT
jgi:hypothetical protein